MGWCLVIVEQELLSDNMKVLVAQSCPTLCDPMSSVKKENSFILYDTVLTKHNFYFVNGLRLFIRLCGLPMWFSGEESTCSVGAAGDMVSVPGSGRFP